MLVSIIIPSFEQAQFLSACIESALEQDHPELEILVVDDAGTDASLAIALHYASRNDRVRVIKRTVNGGLGRARNTGIAFARGELLAFLDSDDCLYPYSVSTRVEAFEEQRAADSSVIGVFGDWQHTTELNDRVDPRRPRDEVPDVRAETFDGENGFICSAPLVLAQAVRDVGGFPEGLPLFEDFAMWTRLIAEGGVFRYVPEIVSTYRQRPVSMLRRSDVVAAGFASAIIDDAMRRGLAINGGDRILRMAESASPRTGQRLAWLRSTQFGTGADDDFGVASTILTKNSSPGRGGVVDAGPEVTVEQRDATSLADAAQDAVELVPAALPGDDASVIVVVPSSFEDALETVALAKGVDDDRTLVVALDEVDLLDVWPLAGLGLPVVPAAEAVGRWPDAAWLVFGDDVGSRSELIGRVGKPRCALRSTGLTALRPLQTGAARRFRQASSIIVRNRLEAAELGDRPVSVVESGVSIGAREAFDSSPDPDLAGPLALYVPAGFIDDPVADTWLSEALNVATAFSHDVVVLSDASATNWPARSSTTHQGGFRVKPVSMRTLRSADTVVVPMGPHVPAFEGLGCRVVVFEPGLADDYSRTLLDHLLPARTASELSARLADAAMGPEHDDQSFASALCAMTVRQDDATAFARDIVAAMEAPR